ncbi:two-component system KDP operon response regulator KdpE [Methylopila capsulata]|uniref:DNA-binding response regulator n=1 Tax=Methylopila capsulata TaxID=61654 RepID=A0A9W6IX60_9HYPH|nr:response regulator transcription factor [Methylopila capsulata]MBM7852680.1 two-component system KDP operon response regulator KdpE [Methylopila capsulata]GLK56889.1 DNA-binding response regulator [Methylopila capsulata]
MASSAITVLIVDDEAPIRRFLKATLAVNDYRTFEAETAAEALRLLRHVSPELVLLDLGLPDMDGLDVIRAIRAGSPVPIVVLSSRGDEAAKVAALDLGADDYVTKPFGADELMARMRAALRHRLADRGAEPVFSAGPLTVDLARHLVTRDGAEVKLSPKEFAILRELIVHAGKVLTHRHLFRAVWGQDDGDQTSLRVFIRQLRVKLEADPARPSLVLTEPGVGYRLSG